MDKLKELILHVLSKFPEGLTEEELSWILFKLDMETYAKTGKPLIENAKWIKGDEFPLLEIA